MLESIRWSGQDSRPAGGNGREKTRTRSLQISLAVGTLLVLLAVLVVTTGAATAHGDGHEEGGETNPDWNTSVPCNFENPGWRDGQTIAGVEVQASKRCRPDNPYVVAASVAGTNNVGMKTLMKSGLARDAVVKKNDRDGDGDPDEIHITLEIAGINERNETDVTHEIAPGVDPGFWAFSPKARGMVSKGSKAEALIGMPSPTLRVEEGDTVFLHVENTHYLPHTIHLHGVDHPFQAGGSGNDGVPQSSERPIKPGEERTYQLSARQAGTMFYHCHVVPNVHVAMGLTGMFVIEEDRPHNTVQTLNLRAGKVRHPSRTMDRKYAAEYDMVYQSADKELHDIPKHYDDTRRVARAVNREHDVTDGSPDYFLLNGRSYPYTLWESVINVEPNEDYRLRILNTGSNTISLHTHGHKFTIRAYDGVELRRFQQITRDVLAVETAQRVDITLSTDEDGTNSYGPGAWIFHDHHEQGVTTDGIAPGGTVSMINYPQFRTDEGLPRTATDLSKFFDPDYYEGEVPFWASLDKGMYGPVPGEDGSHDDGSDGGHDDGTHSMSMGGGMMMDMQMVPNGTIVNENTDVLPSGCSAISGTRSETIHAGQEYADPGEAFGYSKEAFHFSPCQKVTITFVNEDEIRHQWMLHGLPKDAYPMGMFNIEARQNGSVTATFITPAENQTMHLHCSLPQHEQKGMHGDVVIGEGSDHHHEESTADTTGTTTDTATTAGNTTTTTTGTTTTTNGTNAMVDPWAVAP